jgi:hypothetical protein
LLTEEISLDACLPFTRHLPVNSFNFARSLKSDDDDENSRLPFLPFHFVFYFFISQVALDDATEAWGIKVERVEM